MTDKESTQRTVGEKDVTILIADDNAGTRSALRLLIDQEPDLNVVGEASDTGSLSRQLAETQPHLLLLDWELPGLQQVAGPDDTGQTALMALKALTPDLTIIALSGRPEKSVEALAAGADVFVCKGESPKGLASILRSIATNARLERAGHANKQQGGREIPCGTGG